LGAIVFGVVGPASTAQRADEPPEGLVQKSPGVREGRAPYNPRRLNPNIHYERDLLMKLTHIFSGALALVLLIPAFAAADDDLLRETKDRAEIEDLMWRYVRALDTLDPDAYASVFTEDGQFRAGANATKGREALRQMVAGLRQGRVEREAGGAASAPMYHVIANSRLTFVDENSAVLDSYWMTVFGPAGQGEMPRVAAVGRGVDEIVRVDGRWLIRLRDVSPQD
jgi:uncharacterized protein (TIGR02246 family)